VLRASSALSGGFPMSAQTRRTSGWSLEPKLTRFTQCPSIAAGERGRTIRIPTLLPGRQPLTLAVCSPRSPDSRPERRRPGCVVARSVPAAPLGPWRRRESVQL